MGAVAYLTVCVSMSLSIVPRAPITADRADLIEINHYYDHRGKLVFQQVIFWD